MPVPMWLCNELARSRLTQGAWDVRYKEREVHMLRVDLSRRAQTIASVLGIFVALVSVATPHASPISERDGSASAEKISLNGTWQFALAPTKEEAQALENFYREGFDVSDFKATPVPSSWAMLGYEPPQYERFTGSASEGFYLRRFRVPAQWSDRRVLLHFDGVWSSAEVWLNGEALGRHDSGFTKISFDISPALKAGAENLLAVRVRQVQQDYLFDTNDDWTMGGIYRDVSLEIMPKLRWLDLSRSRPISTTSTGMQT